MKTPFIILFLLATLSSTGQNKESLEKTGDSLLSAQLYDKGIAYFDSVLQRNPHNEDILKWLGFFYYAKRDSDNAEKYYREAIAINPNCARCYMNMGRISLQRSDYKKALENFDKAIETDASDGLSYSFRAATKETMGDKFGALMDHAKAVDKAPDIAEVYLRRARYNNGRGFSTLALSDYDKAVELTPNDAEIYLERSSFYYQMENFDAALTEISKAVALDSSNSEIYNGRGAIYEVKKQYENAVADYTRAIALNSTLYIPYANRASAYYKLENMDASCADLATLDSFVIAGRITDGETIQQIKAEIKEFCNPARPSFYYHRGIALYNQHKFAEATLQYDDGLQKFPKNGMLFTFKGNALLELEAYRLAALSYEQAILYKQSMQEETNNSLRLSGASPQFLSEYYNGLVTDAYINLAACYLADNQIAKAEQNIDIASSLIPASDHRNFNLYFVKGQIYLSKGNSTEAFSFFDKTLQLNRDDALTYVYRAIARAGMKEKAKNKQYLIRSTLQNLPVSLSWIVPSSTSVHSEVILYAILDCTKAIALDKSMGYAWYIRGQLKKAAKQDDYCLDLLQAKQLGIEVSPELLGHCK